MSLRTDIADYREHAIHRLHTIERFYHGLTLTQAIEYAASAVDPEGRINPHQRRIGKKRLRQSATTIKIYTAEIKRAKSFTDLFVVTELIKEQNRGLGDLWSYDIALRMAFNRGKSFNPQAVFIHKGVIKGVRKIFPAKRMTSRTLPVSIFPKSLQKLEPFEIENFLCIWGRIFQWKQNKNLVT